MRKPTVSIITPSYNQGKYIEETILSVLNQDYPDIEYIVNDGGSTDNTIDILKKYGNRIKWISEKDRGQADAINKGFRMAKGEIIAWLNSDDTYLPGAISKAVEFLCKNPDVMMVYGDGYEIDENSEMIKKFPATQPFNLRALIYVWDYILQPTVFMRKEAIEKVGFLETDLHWCMDWDLWIRIGKRFKIVYIPNYLANSRVYNLTKTSAGGLKRFKEIVSVMRRHGERIYPLGYLIYGQDTIETLTKAKYPRLYELFLKYVHILLRRLINNKRLKTLRYVAK